MTEAVDAAVLRDAMSRYLEALRAHREEIDSLNVFPIPDGDTGTNMLLTQQGVVEALAAAPDHGERSGNLTALGETISRAALMSARGNSGVILAQALRGLCARLCAGGGMRRDGRDLAAALTRSDEDARRAVALPVEGTMLSVLAAAAEEARRVADRTPDCVEVASAALRAATTALHRTTDQLDDLSEAGVVDAGAKGLLLLFDALHSALTGSDSAVPVGPLGPVGQDAVARPGEAQDHGYEVMYLLGGPDRFLPGLRARLSEIGESLVLVGGDGLYKVHVHTQEPGEAVEAGIEAGQPTQIRITWLGEGAAEDCPAGQLRQVRSAEPLPEPTPEADEYASQSLVAVAEGEGLVEMFRSLGAEVIRGGPGDPPSLSAIGRAIERCPGEVVLVLPNDEAVSTVVEAAARETGKEVDNMGTRNAAEGIAAAVAFRPEHAPDDNHASMSVAMAECGTAAIERTPDGWSVWRPAGERLWGSNPEEVILRVLPLGPADVELVTVYLGRDVDDVVGERIAEAIRQASDGYEVEVRRGEQSSPAVLVAAE
ncbi:MAG: DAK2 domain-containing protein [Actinomycetota bacterium]